MQLAEGKPLAAAPDGGDGAAGLRPVRLSLRRAMPRRSPSGAEKSLNRCVPGGKATARVLKELLEAAPAPSVAAAVAKPLPAPPSRRRRPSSRALARIEGAQRLNRAGSAKDTRHVDLRSRRDRARLRGRRQSRRPRQPTVPRPSAAIIELLSARAAATRSIAPTARGGRCGEALSDGLRYRPAVGRGDRSARLARAGGR